MNQTRIRELHEMMKENSRRNNEIFRQTHKLDDHLLHENIKIRDEMSRLVSAKNLDVGVLA